MQVIDLLRNNELFKGLDEQDLSTLADSTVVRKFAGKCLLFSEGEVANTMYFIVSGKVDICVYDAEVDKEMTLTTLQEGDHFGELSLFDGKPRSASVRTLEPCEFIVLNHEPVVKLLAQNSTFALNVISYLCNKVRFITSIAQDLALLDTYRRLRKFLYRMSDDHNGLTQTKLHLDQSDIASRIGCTREMTNKILRELQTGGYISYQKNAITIHHKLPLAR